MLVARRALYYAQGLVMTVHVFAQNAALAAGGCAHEGAVATRLGLPSIPVAAEVSGVRFWISLVEDTGARIHFCRLSTARGAELVGLAQQRGLPVTRSEEPPSELQSQLHISTEVFCLNK